MSHNRPTATIQEASRGQEWRVFIDGSYRYTAASEHDAREWARKLGIDTDRVEVSR